jgi:hypothetical protein
LRVVTFFADATTPEPTGYDVPRESYYRTVLHHVRVSFGLQEYASVSNYDNSLNVLRAFFFVFYVVFAKLFVNDSFK